jgi:hypothetical protein
MRLFIAPLFACLITGLPVAAQDVEEGPSLMEQGMELFLEGLRQEVEPRMGDLRALAQQFGPSMRSFLEEMGPAFGEMMDQVKDWTDYYPPEMLPNGDIILRRRTPVDPDGDTPQDESDNDALEGGAIDL